MNILIISFGIILCLIILARLMYIYLQTGKICLQTKKIIKKIFPKKEKIIETEIYVLNRKDGNPFKKPPAYVQVIAVENNWINYRFMPIGSMFQNESEKENIFRLIYTKTDKTLDEVNKKIV